MDGDHWIKLKGLFQQLLSLPDLSRAGFLESVLAADEEMGHHLEAMSAVPTSELDHLETLVPRGELAPDQKLGAYTLIRSLGRGGMGEVYLAKQEQPHIRQVAIKVDNSILPDIETSGRLERERAILAQLNHSSIAKLYESGTTPMGRPYFVMELIEGEPITAYADAQRLDLPSRLRLSMQVCEAVSHAHIKGVIHRDLKPQNILVTQENGRPLVKVIDFGIARDLSAESRHTYPGMMPGTLCYMSPEQAGLTDFQGRALEPDFRADVYTLGVVLYQLLTGVLPLEWTAETAWTTAARVLCRGEIDPPWLRFRQLPERERTRIASLRACHVLALQRRLQGDLSRVIMKALATLPEERYASPAALAADLERYLSFRPVEAAPPDKLYLLNRFCRRHFLAVGVSFAILLLLILFSAATFRQNRLITQERDRAEEESRRTRIEAATAEHVTKFLVDMFQNSDPAIARGEALSASDILARGTAEVQNDLTTGEPMVKARLLATLGQVHLNLGLVEEALPLLERCLALRRKLHKGKDHDVADSLQQLGACHYGRGDLDMAETFLNQALAEYRQLGGAPEKEAGCLNDLGLINKDLGRHEISERYYRQALTLRRELFGSEHAMVAESLYNLAALLRARRQFDEAEDLYRESLRQDHMFLAPNHPRYAYSLNGLALLLLDQGDFSGAEPLMHETLALRRQVLGDDHPLVATSINNLGGLYFRCRDYGLAEHFFAEALAQRRRLLGDDHYLSAQAVRNLARNFKAIGAAFLAEDLYWATIGDHRRLRGNEHPTLAGCLLELAQLIMAQGRHHEALPLTIEAEEIWQKALPQEPWLAGRARIYQAFCLAECEQRSAAEKLLRRGIEDFASGFGFNHPLVRMAYARLPDLASNPDNEVRVSKAATARNQ